MFNALPIGGVELFWMTICRRHYELTGRKPVILLLSHVSDSDANILRSYSECAKVYFRDDIFHCATRLSSKLGLVWPVKTQLIKEVFNSWPTPQLHCYEPHHALLLSRFTKIVGVEVKLTVGFYHYMTYTWGGTIGRLPYCLRLPRQLVMSLPQSNLFFFSQDNRDYHGEFFNKDLENARCFRLGVPSTAKDVASSVWVPAENDTLRLVIVARLVDFKAYIYSAIQLVRVMIDESESVVLDIYGDGPEKESLKALIERLNLNGSVKIVGSVPPDDFEKTVMTYDIFIGSGTAIIRAARIGVPSIVGVEIESAGQTYGWFSDVFHREYNMPNLDLPYSNFRNLIDDYTSKSLVDREKLSSAHIKSGREFDEEVCYENFVSCVVTNLSGFSISLTRYFFSYLGFYLYGFIKKEKKFINRFKK